jgi:hypothetical protein
VPGYWAKVEDGWQWVSGFWTAAQTDQLAYLPEPPPSLERGPNVAPPDGDFFWIPGCWTWEDVTYQWRPGYWAPAVEDWVWVPDQYVWTPYGCVFVPGYWDYVLVDRGVLFAPVAFQQPVYTRPNFSYVPTVVVNTAPILMHLFVSPNYDHYFYGNYYAYQPAGGFGFSPWYSYARRPALYDPLLTYYEWSYARRGVNIVNRLATWNRFFVTNKNDRPPVTYAAQQQFLAQHSGANAAVQPAALTLAEPLSRFVRTNQAQFRFRRIDQPARQRFTEHAHALRQVQRQRHEFELASATKGGNVPRVAQPGQAAERPQHTFRLPEATAFASAGNAAGRTASGQDGAAGQSAGAAGPANVPHPPAPPHPGHGRGADGQAGANAGIPDNAERNGRRDRRDEDGSGNPPAANRPNGPPGTVGRPNDAAGPGDIEADQGPQFPRFGVGRNRQAADPNAAPAANAAGDAAAKPPTAAGGRSRRARGFDPFGGPPPGMTDDGAAGGLSDGPPGAGVHRGPRANGNAPGAGLDGAARPEGPGRRGRPPGVPGGDGLPGAAGPGAAGPNRSAPVPAPRHRPRGDNGPSPKAGAGAAGPETPAATEGGADGNGRAKGHDRNKNPK